LTVVLLGELLDLDVQALQLLGEPPEAGFGIGGGRQGRCTERQRGGEDADQARAQQQASSSPWPPTGLADGFGPEQPYRRPWSVAHQSLSDSPPMGWVPGSPRRCGGDGDSADRPLSGSRRRGWTLMHAGIALNQNCDFVVV